MCYFSKIVPLRLCCIVNTFQEDALRRRILSLVYMQHYSGSLTSIPLFCVALTGRSNSHLNLNESIELDVSSVLF